MQMTEQDLREKHVRKFSLFKEYAEHLETVLKDKLSKNSIKYHITESRAKDTESFVKKAIKPEKNYRDPFNEITDLVGLRVITFYEDDLEKIEKQFSGIFKPTQDKEIKIPEGESSFGYRSVHFIFKIDPELKTPEKFKELKDLKFEIQIRTVLQHAWAAISHKLEYKRDSDVPEKLKRKLFRLSALFEIADDEFVSLRSMSELESTNIESKLEKKVIDLPIDAISLRKYIANSHTVLQLSSAARIAGFIVDAQNENDYSSSDTLSRLIQTCNSAGLFAIPELEETLKTSITEAQHYFKKHINSNVTRGSNRWSASVGFICQLIVLWQKSTSLSETHLLDLGWEPEMAQQVFNVAKTFSHH